MIPSATNTAGDNNDVDIGKMTKHAPRRAAKQSRSKETVERILIATWDILSEDGAKAITTRAIAEKAGVNIASIYQFFPNKEAILRQLHQRRLTEVMEVFDRLERPENLALGLTAWMDLCSISFDQLGWDEPGQMELDTACALDVELQEIVRAHLRAVEERITGIYRSFLPDVDPWVVRLMSRFFYGIERVEVDLLATESGEARSVIRQWKKGFYREIIQQVIDPGAPSPRSPIDGAGRAAR